MSTYLNDSLFVWKSAAHMFSINLKILSIVAEITSKIAFGSIALFVSFLAYRINKRKQREDWLREFNIVHDKFWNDEDMKLVRTWLACRPAYEMLREILLKRLRIEQGKADSATLTKIDYESIEKLDKYLNMMLASIIVNPRFHNYRKLWQRLFIFYWINKMQERPALMWYVKEFYSELADPEILNKSNLPTMLIKIKRGIKRQFGSIEVNKNVLTKEYMEEKETVNSILK